MTGEHGGRPRTTTDLGDHVNDLESLLSEVRACCACGDLLPLGPKPVLQMSATARILIASQAPGTKVHASGVPDRNSVGEGKSVSVRVDLGVWRSIKKKITRKNKHHQ